MAYSTSSLIRFMDHKGEANGNGRGPLHWNRAHIDGAPFRGSNPFLTEEEYETQTARVGDAHNRTFDLTNPEENKAYLDVLNMIVNTWAKLIFVERFITSEKKEVYIEWIQWYIEDGTAARQALPGIEPTKEQGSQNGHSG